MTQVRIYASGSGALSFVRVDSKNIACEPHNITMQEARQSLIDKGNPYEEFELIEHPYEGPLLIPIVTRNKETDILSYDRNLFKKISGNWYVAEPSGAAWHLLQNISMLAALRFYEENPKLYEAIS